MDFKTVFDFPLENKTVFFRADLNSSIVEGRVVISSRLREHSKAIYALSEEGAKVVVLSHQGRSKEPEQFISLKRHADFIRKFTGKKVNFITWEEDYIDAVKKLSAGEIIVLENTRFQAEEEQEKSFGEHAESGFVKKLGPLGDIFVLDALSVAHRAHASVVGFKKYMPCVVGPTLERELRALLRLKEQTKNGKLVVLGGAKISDSVSLLSWMLESKMCNEACLGGLFGEIFLKAKGIDFGAKEKFFQEKGFDKMLPEVKNILDRHGEKLFLPVDFAFEENGRRKEVKVQELPVPFFTMDIGRETTELFKSKIRASNIVVFNGPLGIYEDKKFIIGTKKVLEAIAFHRCFSILGGGDTERALSSFGLLPQDFSHVSLAGKALLQYLSNKPLPGLEILERN